MIVIRHGQETSPRKRQVSSTPEELLARCCELQKQWRMPDDGSIPNPPHTIRELLSDLRNLQIDEPSDLPMLPTFSLGKWYKDSDYRTRLFDVFHAALSRIINAVKRHCPKRKRGAAGKKPGQKVTASEHESRKLVSDRWSKFQKNYKKVGYTKATIENFTTWAVDEFDNMPSDDPDVIRRMLENYRKTSNPNLAEE